MWLPQWHLGLCSCGKDIVSSAKPTDEEILHQVAPQSESGSVDDNDDRLQPSVAEIATAVMLLSSVYSEDVTLAEIRANQIGSKRGMRQGSIMDFFKPSWCNKVHISDKTEFRRLFDLSNFFFPAPTRLEKSVGDCNEV